MSAQVRTAHFDSCGGRNESCLDILEKPASKTALSGENTTQ